MYLTIADRGLADLIAKDGEQSFDNTDSDLQGEPDPTNDRFDPLMSMMCEGPESNGGHFCALCALAAHYSDFAPATEVGEVAD